MKYTLPISPEYVAHWGLWEAVREIYQNALDEAGIKGASLVYSEEGQTLIIRSTTGRLTPKTLVLGHTSKRDDPSKRGKFGEGYKLALLVLARLGKDVEIRNGSETWTPRLEKDPAFDEIVLTVEVTNDALHFTSPGNAAVQFEISGVTSKEYAAIKANICEAQLVNQILDDPRERGRIYVGGLSVSTAKGFQCGYAFNPGVVKLDRDRGMVDGFDLAWQTSKLWTERGHSVRLSELLEAEAPDVEYVENHAEQAETFKEAHYGYFVSRHGHDAVPVSSQAEIQRAQGAGLKWVLVPEKVKSILRMVRDWIIPSNKTAVERLREFEANYRYYLPTQGRQELADILKTLEPQQEKK